MDRTTLCTHLLMQTGFLNSATSHAFDQEPGCMRLRPVPADVPAIGADRYGCRLDSKPTPADTANQDLYAPCRIHNALPGSCAMHRFRMNWQR